MRLLELTLAGALLLGLNLSASSAIAADGWQAATKVNREMKRMRRKGMIATSMTCRNEPGAANRLKPEARVIWEKNVSNKDWAAFLYKGQLDFMPGNRNQIKQWRRLYKKRLRAGASGAIFNCTLWHKK